MPREPRHHPLRSNLSPTISAGRISPTCPGCSCPGCAFLPCGNRGDLSITPLCYERINLAVASDLLSHHKMVLVDLTEGAKSSAGPPIVEYALVPPARYIIRKTDFSVASSLFTVSTKQGSRPGQKKQREQYGCATSFPITCIKPGCFPTSTMPKPSQHPAALALAESIMSLLT